jgi:cell wall-associated NlpC family hydrolase
VVSAERTSNQAKKSTSSISSIGRGSVTGININVRSGPSTDSSVVTKVSGGEVKILAQKGNWYKLRFAYGTEGWVRGDNVKVTGKKYTAPSTTMVAKKETPAESQTLKIPQGENKSEESSAAKEATRFVNLVARKVTVRKGPSDSNSAVTTVKGGRAEVKDKWGSWVKLQFQYGTVGWVRIEACEFPDNFAYKSDENRPRVASAKEPIKKEEAKPILPPVKDADVPPVDDQKDAQKDANDAVKTDDKVKIIEITDEEVKKTELDSNTTEPASTKRSDGTKYATINSASVNVRKGPSTTNSTVAKVSGGTARVIDQRGEWFQLKFSGGTVGWVRKDLLTISENGVPTKPAIPVAQPADEDTVEKLIREAREFTGVRYNYGSANRGATDCSGFTLQSFKAIGINLPRTARQQIYCGTKVARNDLKRGDLIFFNTRGFVSHVGIYLGNGRFIHASSGGGKVQENSLGESYYNNRFIGARRVIKPKKVASLSPSTSNEIDSEMKNAQPQEN